jgi:hypothetical protein
MKGKKVDVICAFCGKAFAKRVADANRSNRIGKRHLCSRSCAGKLHNKEQPSDASNLRKPGIIRTPRKPTKDSPFRWFMRRAKLRFGSLCDITIPYLAELWEKQQGKCPFTGWTLILPIHGSKWENNKKETKKGKPR